MQEVEKRGLQVAVAGIPKTIDNDIAVRSIHLNCDFEFFDICAYHNLPSTFWFKF